jgi:putative ABC transport system permease protein
MQAGLKTSIAQSGSSGSRLKIRNFLAGAEIALAMVLVIAAGLLVRSLMAMTSVDPGFEVAHVLKAEVSLPRYQYSTTQQWIAFSNTLLQRIHAQPGLKSSALAVPLPVVDQQVNLKFSIADHPALPPSLPATADYVSASPSYFSVMGIPLLHGRLFSEGDSSTTPPVTIISEALARSYFPNENPLGKRLVFGFPPGPPIAREIIGVVADIHETQLGQKPGPMMYVPFAQAPFWGGELVVKSTLPAAAIVASVRQVVRGIDKNLPVTDIASMPDVIQASTSQPRFRTWLLGLFGVVALLLAAAGVFGVVSYSVASRRREFGVRAALGASPGLIGRMVLGEGLSLTAAGLLAGLIASFALVRFLRSELYGVGAYDPLTFLVSAAVLLSVALLACFIPAWRAMRADPMITLRCE